MNFYKEEWLLALAAGNLKYAEACKHIYRKKVIESLKRPYKMYIEKLKQFPMIYLN